MHNLINCTNNCRSVDQKIGGKFNGIAVRWLWA
jgi:hypothetical protein